MTNDGSEQSCNEQLNHRKWFCHECCLLLPTGIVRKWWILTPECTWEWLVIWVVLIYGTTPSSYTHVPDWFYYFVVHDLLSAVTQCCIVVIHCPTMHICSQWSFFWSFLCPPAHASKHVYKMSCESTNMCIERSWFVSISMHVPCVCMSSRRYSYLYVYALFALCLSTHICKYGGILVDDQPGYKLILVDDK